ncbi:MAG: hypothetical protein JNN15_05295 [Blastocatellia bacterium]|nr:hypothetical protein [Blastocatellia bacterium]
MSELVCLYCKATNQSTNDTSNVDTCVNCGMPLSISRPEDLIVGFNQRSDKERISSRSGKSDTFARLRMYAAIGLAVVACIGGVIIESRTAKVEQTIQQDTRIVLDQTVGATPVESLSSDLSSSKYLQAEELFKQGNFDAAKQLLREIREDEKDFSKAIDLLKEIEQIKDKQ